MYSFVSHFSILNKNGQLEVLLLFAFARSNTVSLRSAGPTSATYPIFNLKPPGINNILDKNECDILVQHGQMHIFIDVIYRIFDFHKFRPRSQHPSPQLYVNAQQVKSACGPNLLPVSLLVRKSSVTGRL